MNIVIVGGSFGGVHCALKAKELYPTASVCLIDKEKKLGYLPCGLSLYFNHTIASLQEAYFLQAQDLLAAGVQLELDTIVMSIDYENNEVITTRGNFTYDRLVLATGSQQLSSRLKDDYQDVLTYKDVTSAEYSLKQLLQSDSVAIVGAGQAGMELASSLRYSNKKLVLLESLSYPLSKYFDDDFLQPFLTHLKTYPQVTLYSRETVKQVKKICPPKRFKVTTQRQEYEVDTVVLATNVRPRDVDFFDALQKNSDRTLATNEYLETSIPGVFAIGDLIQLPLKGTNEKIYMPLISHAIQTGELCAKNLVSLQEKMTPVVRTIGTYLFDYYLASCGLTEEEAYMYHDAPVISRIDLLELSAVGTRQKVMRVKVVIDQTSRVILGAQLMSKSPILDKINVYALAVEQELTIDEFKTGNYFYQPQYTNSLKFSDIFRQKDVDECEL